MQAFVGHAGKRIAEKVSEQLVDYLGRSDDDTMRSLKRSWERLRSQAKDIEDEVKKEEMSCKKKMKTEVKSWLKEVNGLKPECDELEVRVISSRLPLFGDPVKNLQCRVNELIEQRNHFKELVLDDFDNNGEPYLPTKLFGNKTMGTLNEIWPCLVVDNISSIGIYGMGGVGKTTLAKRIKFELEQSNYRVYWVTVSQEFSIRNLQEKIANILGISLLNKDEEHARADILRATFNKMEKSILILDDLWEEFLLEKVGIVIHADNCRLIWTSRSLQVCHRMRCQRKFEVKTLNEKESWDLFKHTLGSETVLFEEVERIAKSVAERCAGLPLGIVTTAASMRGVTDIREWKAALGRLNSFCDEYHEMEDKVFRILEYSFNHLRGCEIPCFLYCSLYPEDHEIKREPLIDLFVSAGLISKRVNMELERIEGHAILSKLARVCLLEETKDSEGVECVRMHDLIRDMALRITSGKYISKVTKDVPRFLVKSKIKKSNDLLVEKEELKDDLDAVSLMGHSYDYIGLTLEFPALVSSNCWNLSTLIINHVNITEIPDSFFQQMYGLKVLNLEGCWKLRALPRCVSNLENLTALLLKNCERLESVPPLGKLKRLRILNLLCTGVVDVPQGLEELVDLERLYFYSCGVPRGALAFPEGKFSKLHRLQHLVLMPGAVHINDIVVLKELELFIGGLTLACAYYQLSKSWRWPSAFDISIRNKFSDFNTNFGGALVEDYIRNIQKGSENKLDLSINKCSGFSDIFFHRWIDGSKALYNLNLLNLEELKYVLNFSSLENDDDEEGVTSNLVGGLLNLRVLRLRNLQNLVKLINWRLPRSILPVTFSSLEELIIVLCDRLKKLFSVQLLQQSLQNLKFLEVSWCYEVEETVGNNDEEEAMEFQACSSGCMPSTAHFLLLPKLQRLTLSDLPKLESVCCPTITIGGDQPTTFHLDNCAKLKSLPSFSSARITYEIKGCYEWWNSLEWENLNDKDAVQPFFQAYPILKRKKKRKRKRKKKKKTRMKIAWIENVTSYGEEEESQLFDS